ncbi:MAG: hypothetical protein HY854_25155 [Burkholderiales bacterium]|nr:hypothetical protein [Burkholderiales bacterium]
MAQRSTAAFWLDLNVFVAAFLLLAGLGIAFLYVPLALAGKLVMPAQRAEVLAMPAAYAVLAAMLAWAWWSAGGLSPAVREEGKERQFHIGHGLLFASNAATAMVFAPAIGGASLALSLQASALSGVMTLLPTAATVAAIAGILLVHGSRRAPPTLKASTGFAATQPVPDDDDDESGEGKAARVGLTLGALAGLVASSVLIMIALVFAAIGMQYRAGQFTGFVVPVVAVTYIVYLAGSVWLALNGRAAAALGLAWAPAVLMTLGLPLVQVVVMLAGALLGQ